MRILARSAYNDIIRQCGQVFSNQWEEFEFSEAEVAHLNAYPGVEVKSIEPAADSDKDLQKSDDADGKPEVEAAPAADTDKDLPKYKNRK